MTRITEEKQVDLCEIVASLMETHGFQETVVAVINALLNNAIDRQFTSDEYITMQGERIDKALLLLWSVLGVFQQDPQSFQTDRETITVWGEIDNKFSPIILFDYHDLSKVDPLTIRAIRN